MNIRNIIRKIIYQPIYPSVILHLSKFDSRREISWVGPTECVESNTEGVREGVTLEFRIENSFRLSLNHFLSARLLHMKLSLNRRTRAVVFNVHTFWYTFGSKEFVLLSHLSSPFLTRFPSLSFSLDKLIQC